MANVDISKNVTGIAGKRFMPKVANATFYINGVPAFKANANTDTQVNIQTTQNQIRAGQNNSVIGTVLSEKQIDVSFSTPEWKIEFLAANIGETIQIGNFSFEVTDLTLPATAGVITLSEIPSDNQIYVEINEGYVTVPVTSTTVDLKPYGITSDKCVSAIGTFTKSGKRVNLSADSDPLVGKLILESPIFDGGQGEIGQSQYVFPAFALSGNWNHGYKADTSYEISGTAIATSSAVCGEGQSYGFYQEYYYNKDEIAFSMIVASPSTIELTVGETEIISVYGAKSNIYDKSVINGATFATEDTTYFTVGADTGLVTAVSQGTGTVTVTYNGMTTTVDVEVIGS